MCPSQTALRDKLLSRCAKEKPNPATSMIKLHFSYVPSKKFSLKNPTSPHPFLQRLARGAEGSSHKHRQVCIYSGDCSVTECGRGIVYRVAEIKQMTRDLLHRVFA